MSADDLSRPTPPKLTMAEAEALASQYGLQAISERPPLRQYIRDIWRRRALLWSLASAQAYAKNTNNYLGQVWAVLNPLLLVGAYYLIFGLLLGTTKGIDNYVGFLTIGIFMFMYTSSALTSGSKAIVSNVNLVRALRFPRAILPFTVILREFLINTPAFLVLVVLMFVTGETPQVKWLLFPLALVMTSLVNLGLALLSARLVNAVRDVANLIPVTVRLLRYVSGVFFSIKGYAGGSIWGHLLAFQPVALSLEVTRQSLLSESTVEWNYWLGMAAWALLLPLVGFILFWRAEARYGRD